MEKNGFFVNKKTGLVIGASPALATTALISFVHAQTTPVEDVENTVNLARLAPKSLTLSEGERQELEKLLYRHSTPQQIALRAKIILLAAQGNNNREIGQQLNVSRFMARRWRNRWLELSKRSIRVRERLDG